MAASSALRLEDLPAHEIPQVLRPLKISIIDAVEKAILTTPASITLHQRKFAVEYTRAVIEKGTLVRMPLAVVALVEESSYSPLSEMQRKFLTQVQALLKGLPEDERAKASMLLQALKKPKEAPTMYDQVKSQELEQETAEIHDHPKVFIRKMQECLASAKQELGRYEEALAYARRALAIYPNQPNVLLWAATCYRASAGDGHQRREDRLGNLRQAIQILEHTLGVMSKPPYANVEEYTQHKTTARTALTKMRELFAGEEKKSAK